MGIVTQMFRQFALDRQGYFAIGVTAAMVPLILAVGLAVDVTNMDRVRSNTQAALDAAAMEIALNVQMGLTDEELERLGQVFMTANLRLEGATVDEELMPSLTYLGVSVDSGGRQHLDVEAFRAFDYFIPRGFGGKHGAGRGEVRVRSRISSSDDGPACVYALNPTAARALQAGGNTTVNMEGCIIASNSNAADGLYVGGSASVAADCAQSVGGISATAGLVTSCERNRERAWRMADPFEKLVEPVPPMLLPNPPGNATTLSPGRYSNLSLNGTVTLQPGLYFIEGKLDLKGTISGSGVTFFLKDGGVTSNGNASLHLSAPSVGEHAGMLFWSAKGNTSDQRFNGNGATDLDGFLYFPSAYLDYLGNNSLDATCMRIVADRIKLSGNSTVKLDCSQELGEREARIAGPLYYSR